MLFRAAMLLLLAFQRSSTTTQSQSELSIPTASAITVRTISENEQSTSQEKNGSKLSHSTRKRPKLEAQTQTLIGTVEWEYKPLAWDCDVPNCDHFALYDDATQANYELDDARAALPYEGKRAKVTGVLNTKDSIIHVISIEAVK